MRALIKGGAAQADTRVTEASTPVAGDGQVVLQVEACGLCGSDVHAWRGDDGYEWVTTPVIMGHEVAGRVISVGNGVLAPQVGDRVVPISILGCGECEICAAGDGPLCTKRNVLGLSRDGGAAEFVLSAADELIMVPAGMPATRAALTEPLSVALHAIAQFSGLGPGRTVGVCGPGPVGLLAAWALKQRGIDVFVLGTDRDRALRLPAARALGIDAFTPEEREVPQADFWIEASGSEGGLNTTVQRTTPQGQISIVALFGRKPVVDISIAVRRQLKIFGSYASLPADYQEAIDLLGSHGEGIEDVLVTVVPLDEAAEALAATAEGRVVKAMLQP